MVSLKDAKSYMHIDHDEDDELINRCIFAAEEYLLDAIGEGYDGTSERARMLTLMVVSDLYDSRGTTERASVKTRTIVENFAQQMRLKLRRNSNVPT